MEARALPLRVRLSLAFVAVVVVPLLVTVVLIQIMLARASDARTDDRLSDVSHGVETVIGQLQVRAEAGAVDLARTNELGRAVRDRDLRAVRDIVELRSGGGADDVAPAADFIAVLDARGSVIASAGRRPIFLNGVEHPSVNSIAAKRVPSPFAVSGWARFLDSSSRPVGSVMTGFWLDAETVRELRTSGGDNIVVLVNGRPVASTFTSAANIERVSGIPARSRPVESGGWFVARRPLAQSVPGAELVIATRADPVYDAGSLLPVLVAIVVAFVLIAAMLGWLLARLTTKPLEELSDAAMNIASGKFDTRIVVPPSREVGRLAIAFNAMSDELTSYVHALEGRQDDLKRNLTRLGETLSSTHDLNKMLSVILETAIATLRADAGALMLFSANRDELYIKVGRGLHGRLDDPAARVRVGEGVAGVVGRSGEPLHGPVGNRPGDMQMSPAEPRARAVIAVPLKGQGRIQGVLNLYDKEGARHFDDEDLATLRTFATQATVAIDNVLLHHEAQRLSITDGLTGLWNYRYFQMTFDKEIERASRFGRPMSLLILDLDKFKDVNDTYGHQRGDSVLIELATRIKGAIREVDTLARYGGEEFVLILPETDLAGAEQAAEKVCELVRQRRFGSTDEEPLRLTISIGIAVYPDHGDTPAMLVKAADTALYAAKARGRDRHEVGPVPTGMDVDTAPTRTLAQLAPETRNALESAAAAVVRPGSSDIDRTGEV